MSVGTLVPLAEYLATSYDPDVEYVDGVLVERNVGDLLHSLIQRNGILTLSRKYPQLFALPELRSRTKTTRYRLPDVAVLLRWPETRFLLEPAHIAVEILSEDDRMTEVVEKVGEYEAAGFANVWLVDPRLELLSVYSHGNLTRVEKLATPDGIELTHDDIFAQ